MKQSGQLPPLRSPNGNSSCRGSERRRVWVLPLVRRRIGQALADGTFDGAIGALYVVDAELGAVVVAEIKFREIAIDVLLVDVLIDADQPALEHAKEAFKGVGVRIATDVLALGMVNGFVLTGRHDLAVVNRAIGTKLGILVELAPQRLPHGAVIQELRADRAAALDEAEDLGLGALMGRALGLGRLGDPGFVSLDNSAT